MEIIVYCDGSCKPSNPGYAGFGCFFLKDGSEWFSHNGYLGPGTNNVAEIKGVEYALDFLKQENLNWESVKIITDSQYVIGMFQNNWKATKNTELVLAVRKKLENFPNLEFQWVKGHSKNKYNDLVDALANQAVDEGMKNEG